MGVDNNKHSITFGSAKACSNSLSKSCPNYGASTEVARIRGVLPFLSFMFLSAPRISSCLTGLMLFRVITDFTAKCNGVYPSIS